MKIRFITAAALSTGLILTGCAADGDVDVDPTTSEAPADETEAPAEETEAPAEETEAPAEETEMDEPTETSSEG